jgi:hypothetical protein
MVCDITQLQSYGRKNIYKKLCDNMYLRHQE